MLEFFYKKLVDSASTYLLSILSRESRGSEDYCLSLFVFSSISSSLSLDSSKAFSDSRFVWKPLIVGDGDRPYA